MHDYGQNLEFGYFLIPDADDPSGTLASEHPFLRSGQRFSLRFPCMLCKGLRYERTAVVAPAEQ
jgi:hypothetical protein